MHTVPTINKLTGTSHFPIKLGVLGKRLTLFLEILHELNLHCLYFKCIQAVLMIGENNVQEAEKSAIPDY